MKHITLEFHKTLLLAIYCFVVLATILITSIPMELEYREGANWLHALALNQGINIFDPNIVAFVNFNHGPFDAIIKSIILRIYPEIKSHYLTRVFCILIPVSLFILSFESYKFKNHRLTLSLTVSLTCYLSLIILSGLIFVGRSDATAFFLLIVTLWLLSKNKNQKPILKFFIGILLSCVVLSNWRYAIVAPVLYLFFRKELNFNFISFISLLVIPFTIIYIYYDFNFTLYLKHYFGFFISSGWNTGLTTVSNFSENYASKFIEYFLAFWDESFIYKIILALNLVSLVAFLRMNTQIRALLLTFILCSLSLFLNFKAVGDLNYYFPLIALIWFLFLINNNIIINIIQLNVQIFYKYLIIIEIFGIAVTLNLFYSYRPLYLSSIEFSNLITSTRLKNNIYSESIFFFENKIIPVVDTGDAVWVISNSGYLGTKFTETVLRNVRSLQDEPPKYIISSPINSEPIKIIIKDKYTLVKCGIHETCLYKNNSE